MNETNTTQAALASAFAALANVTRTLNEALLNGQAFEWSASAGGTDRNPDGSSEFVLRIKGRPEGAAPAYPPAGLL